MPNCPHCHQPTDSQAVRCPHCGLTLKAYGHPGMTLYRAEAGESLCSSCTYHHDNTCNFPKRPNAKDCTLYQSIDSPDLGADLQPPSRRFKPRWEQGTLVWLTLAGLLLVSLLIALT